ncbi:hypothetical protein [Actinoplanes derwentensis]|uniref:SMI1/KNR4 family protein n=1 Tax=Actinoplanes derwentensis TaxID=113562 RepID=A0A1H1TW58_9ACTN|nr:hypothetical protein [Actinoplanes derwentensis]GID85155.1 hypothetical protein Ade03nite_40790 [Actinoplanes derwentensis]SDS64440.1 hypothetical protein SAMN04489716_1260 [Actinoplanes derwentensis]
MAEITGTALGEEAGRRLARTRQDVQPGLTESELDRVEQTFGFTFADDHRAFLHIALPVGDRKWPDWRAGDPADLRAKLDLPVDGVLFDVEHNRYWHPGWGSRPPTAAAAVESAREHLATVPVMVPVYGHRFLPAGRGTSGHPVLSIHQTDVIIYGTDLLDYLHQEFGTDPTTTSTNPQVTVPFWRDLTG